MTMDETDHRDSDESDELESKILRANRPFAVDRFGTTAEEARAGEGLDRALAQEVADEGPTTESVSVVDEGPFDDEAALVGDAVLQRDDFPAPEEAALTVGAGVPGATDHDDPHPVDEDEDG